MEFRVPLLSGMWLLFLLSILFPIPGKSLLDPFGLELDLLAQPPHRAWDWGVAGRPHIPGYDGFSAFLFQPSRETMRCWCW